MEQSLLLQQVSTARGPDIAYHFREGAASGATDGVTLDHAGRLLRRRRLVTDTGRYLHVDLPRTVSLEDGDAFETTDGTLIAVRAAPEALIEITAPPDRLAAIAWHIGNRHKPAEIAPDRIRIQADPVLAEMLERLGATLTPVTAPFTPEAGAYGRGRTQGHDHAHADAPASESSKLPELQVLTQLFSQAFPVGGFSYSHGLEWMLNQDPPPDFEPLLRDILAHGAGRSDAILMAHAARTDDPAPLSHLAAALAPSSERLLESRAQGRAFARTASAVWGTAIAEAPLPVAAGATIRALDLPRLPALTLFLQGFSANLISVGVRLIPIGQTEGQALLARLQPLCRDLARACDTASLDEIGNAALQTDLASMVHETQHTRLYRS